MDVATITMDPAEAQEQLEEYARVLRRRADDEYRAVRDGLEALARGEAVLNLGDVIRAAPLDEKSRPRLAIARADRKQVRFEWRGGQTAEFATKWGWSRGQTTETMVHRIDMARRHGRTIQLGDGTRHEVTVQGYALVPMVPAAGLRFCGGFSGLRHHFILWEVETWADRPISSTPDRDPYLLRHLGGELYAVVYEWDLTELERAVMAGRRNG